MKTLKLLTLLVSLSFVLGSCAKEAVETAPQQKQEEEQKQEEKKEDEKKEKAKKYFSISDGFDDCFFVAYVYSGTTCKNIFIASGWNALVDTLTVSKDQNVVLVASSDTAGLRFNSLEPGKKTKEYTVSQAPGCFIPELWSCSATADSTNKAAFEPVPRTYEMSLDIKNIPADLDSVTVDLKQMLSLCPGSPGIYAGIGEAHYSIAVADLGKTFHFLPMSNTSSELYQVLNFHYTDRYRNCMVHFDSRASARCKYAVSVDLTESEADFVAPTLSLEASGDSTINRTLSMWDHLYGYNSYEYDKTEFEMQSGVNLGFRFGSGITWDENGDPWLGWDHENDVKMYSGCGYDHFRIPIDEETIFYEDCTPRPLVMDNVKELVDFCIAANCKVIIDLHWLKISQGFPNVETEMHYRACWEYLHEHFKDYPVDMLAYELVNEPNSPMEYWNFFVKNSIEMVRNWGGNELDRVIFCACRNGQDVSGTDDLELPSDTDPNLVMTYHDYTPALLTFYWPISAELYVPFHYPGQLVTTEEYALLTPEQQETVPLCSFYKYDLAAPILHAAQNGKRLGVPVFCGEYGCSQAVPVESRRNWTQDKCDLFRQYGMSFSSWFLLGPTMYDPNPDAGIVAAAVVKKQQ